MKTLILLTCCAQQATCTCTTDWSPVVNSLPRICWGVIGLVALYFVLKHVVRPILANCHEVIAKRQLFWNDEQIKKTFSQLFNKVLSANKNHFVISEIPFFLSLQIFNNIKNKGESQIILFLSEGEINKQLQDILKGISNQPNGKDIQLILGIYWNEKYQQKLLSSLRAEKIDKLIEPDLEIKEKKQILNESIDSTTRSSKGSNNEDIQKLQRERYNNLYEKYSNLSCAPPNFSNANNNISQNIDNNNKIECQKNENTLQLPNLQNGNIEKVSNPDRKSVV